MQNSTGAVSAKTLFILIYLVVTKRKTVWLRPVLSQTINGKQSAVHLCGNVSERWQQKKKATAPTPSPLQQICKVTELNISFNHVKMSSSLLEVMQKRRYYQYQGFMRGIELLQNLIHDGVGQVGDHRQLHLPGEEQRKESGCWAEVRPAACSHPVLLQSSVNVLCCPLHEGITDAGARDGHLLGDGWKRRVEPLGCRAGHRTQLAAERHHRVHHNLCTGDTDHASHARLNAGQISIQLWHCQLQINDQMSPKETVPEPEPCSGLLSYQFPSVCCCIPEEWK